MKVPLQSEIPLRKKNLHNQSKNLAPIALKKQNKILKKWKTENT